MKIITRQPVTVLFAASDHESAEIGFIDRFIVGKPGVAIDPEDTAFCFKTFINGIEPDNLINYGLDECFEVSAGFFISAAVFTEPISIIMNFKIRKKGES